MMIDLSPSSVRGGTGNGAAVGTPPAPGKGVFALILGALPNARASAESVDAQRALSESETAAAVADVADGPEVQAEAEGQRDEQGTAEQVLESPKSTTDAAFASASRAADIALDPETPATMNATNSAADQSVANPLPAQAPAADGTAKTSGAAELAAGTTSSSRHAEVPLAARGDGSVLNPLPAQPGHGVAKGTGADTVGAAENRPPARISNTEHFFRPAFPARAEAQNTHPEIGNASAASPDRTPGSNAGQPLPAMSAPVSASADSATRGPLIAAPRYWPAPLAVGTDSAPESALAGGAATPQPLSSPGTPSVGSQPLSAQVQKGAAVPPSAGVIGAPHPASTPSTAVPPGISPGQHLAEASARQAFGLIANAPSHTTTPRLDTAPPPQTASSGRPVATMTRWSDPPATDSARWAPVPPGAGPTVPPPGSFVGATPVPDLPEAQDSLSHRLERGEVRAMLQTGDAALSMNAGTSAFGAQPEHGITAPRPPADLARDAAQQIGAQVLNHGKGRFELSLSPTELGKVDMMLHETDNRLTLTVNAERPETLDLIRRHIAVLEMELRQMGLGNMSLQLGTGGMPDAPKGQAREGLMTGASNDAPTEPARPPARALAAGDHLDLRL